MKIKNILFLLVIVFLYACAVKPNQTTSQKNTQSTIAESTEPVKSERVQSENNAPDQTQPVPSATPFVSPTPGKTILVTSAEDSGPGSLRQAMQQARPGDSITFDASIFQPEKPPTIQLRAGLPPLTQDGITIDASNAGVILDGSQADGEWQAGLEITSNNNSIMGLEIANFSGPGFLLQESARNNRIGGDRSIGKGPFGQGNLIRNTSDGIAIKGSENVIQGNLIGTDKSGTKNLGNRNPGIFLEEKASRNIIGPGNIIAYNGLDSGGGVEIRTLEGQGNRITQNNIHDNASVAIFYNLNTANPGNNVSIPQSPIFTGFNLEKGNVSGIACAGCTVEFFTSDKTGENFEGSIQANETGNFIFNKQGSFKGDLLKATSSAEDQNTSEVSAPIKGHSYTLILQKGNTYPFQYLPEVAFDNLSFNNIGTMVSLANCRDDGSEASYASEDIKMGYKWTRINIDWFDLPEVIQTGEYSAFAIKPCQERAIDILNRSGIAVYDTITYWDPEIKITNGYSRFRNQAEIDRYIEYARFIVEHFKGKIQWYSILNEPNLLDGQQAVHADDYINLIRQVIPAIKEIDPQAKVAVGEVTPLNEAGSLLYLLKILRSDVIALADGIAWHGSSGNSLDYQPDFYRDYPKWVDNIVSTAREHGFTGQFIADELHWRTANTPQPIGGKPWFYSDKVAGKYYARGMILHLAKGLWISVGHEKYTSIPDVTEVITNLTRLFAGGKPVEIISAFEKPSPVLRSVAFSLPDDSRLIALWRDVKAVDDDPGEEHSISLAGVQADKVIGIDPLYGVQQELNFTHEGNITIPDYVIHDYPTFIHIEGYTKAP